MTEHTSPADTVEIDRPPAPALPAGRLVLGAVLVLIGALWLLDAAGVTALRWGVVLPATLTVVGVALVATARRGAHGGLMAAGIVLSALVLASAMVPVAVPFAGVGERVERPASLAELETRYELGVGKLTIDLRQVDELGDATVAAGIGVGELVIRLPRGVGAEVEASVGMGEITILERSRGGFAVSVSDEIDGEPVVTLDVSAGMGRVEVRR